MKDWADPFKRSEEKSILKVPLPVPLKTSVAMGLAVEDGAVADALMVADPTLPAEEEDDESEPENGNLTVSN